MLFENKLQLHLVERDNENNRDSRLFHDKETDVDDDIKCAALIHVFQYSAPAVLYFFLYEWKFINEYRHTCTVALMYLDLSGARLVFVDEKQDA